jgi:hypothetical protein
MSANARLSVPLVALVAGVALAAIPAGCNRKETPPAITVRGIVTFQGQPLNGGLVVFSPDPERGHTGMSARGELGSDGTFQLSTREGQSIAPGWYRVAIAPAPTLLIESNHDQPIFPRQLARPDKSQIVREVKAGQENVFEFAVEVPNG